MASTPDSESALMACAPEKGKMLRMQRLVEKEKKGGGGELREVQTRIVKFASLADAEATAAYNKDLFQFWLGHLWEDTLGDAASDVGRRIQDRLCGHVGITTGCCG
jgi:hypothetical protein